MGLGMSMEPRLRHVLICAFCSQPSTEHDENCVQGLLETLVDGLKTYPCRKCPGRVERNRDDFLECSTCHTQYSRSMVVAGAEPDTLEQVHLFDGHDEVLQVLVLPEQGQGDFPVRDRIAELCAERERLKAEFELK